MIAISARTPLATKPYFVALAVLGALAFIGGMAANFEYGLRHPEADPYRPRPAPPATEVLPAAVSAPVEPTPAVASLNPASSAATERDHAEARDRLQQEFARDHLAAATRAATAAERDLAHTTGTVGAIIGGPIRAVIGDPPRTVAGISDTQQPQFRQYVVTQGRPSYRYNEEVRVGATLPSSGITYYEVPEQYGVREYRYTVVNDTPVLVDPRSRRIVQIIR